MRVVVKSSKAGFTLLEVLLATVILVIASTMIMQGFIAVMVLGANTRSYAKSGENNYRLALNEAVVQHATASNQNDDMNSLTTGSYSTITAASINPPATGVTVNDVSLIVDLHSYSNNSAIYTTNVDAQAVDSDAIANNRFAFFYDFPDFMSRSNGAGSPHVMRWGYTIDASDGFSHAGTNHGDYDTPIYVDGQEDPIYYGRFGWYCFNEDHNGQDCRMNPYESPLLPHSTGS